MQQRLVINKPAQCWQNSWYSFENKKKEHMLLTARCVFSCLSKSNS